MPTSSEYVQRARARLVELLQEHMALVHPEAIARLSEAGTQTLISTSTLTT